MRARTNEMPPRYDRSVQADQLAVKVASVIGRNDSLPR